MKAVWKPNHRFTLLENGEAFFPRIFDVIRNARSEVLIETFILFDDKVGQALRDALIEAARRGVRVELTVDGFGSPDLSDEFVHGMTEAGVRFHVFKPAPSAAGLRLDPFRRLHRKLAVVDGERAFIGGINYSADHFGDFGPQAKQDYSVEIEGPLVEDIRAFMESSLQPRARAADRRRHESYTRPGPGEDGWAAFVMRDNDRHQTDIEQHYRMAIRLAQREVIIANAYFFPGFRLLREMRRAARRGVRVHLITQGEPDTWLARWAPRQLYRALLRADVEVHEYRRRPLHGKVAVVDEEWATIGSSNLDPLSLSLNLEANLVIRDRSFNQHLRERLQSLMQQDCVDMRVEHLPRRSVWQWAIAVVVFHVLRHFPRWMRRLPSRSPHLKTVEPQVDLRRRRVA